MQREKSDQLFKIAKECMPGGVSSPVRAFKAVGMDPLFIQRGQGARIYDVDGNEFIDYVGSFGPLILGHSHPEVVKAIREAAQNGTSYGAPCEKELELAQMICSAIPSIEKIRFVNSGTEATMSAIRLARAYTGRSKIVKFEGCYHGHADSFLIKAGSGLLTSGVPNSAGVLEEQARNTLVARYNDLESVEKIFREEGRDIAAVIVEPVAGNMGLVLPDPDFLKGLRKITSYSGSLLIFDEVITGFRICYGGFQDFAGITPDLTTLGKIIGGGLPVGAYGGRKDIMSRVAPEGDVYQAGTLSGNPLAMAAGVATLKILQDRDWYDRLEVITYMLATRLKTVFEEHGFFYTINRIGSMFSVFFTESEVKTYEDVLKCDTAKYAQFYRHLLEEGVYFPPSQFEVCFVSCAHEMEDIEATVQAVARALDKMA
ncbi:glutamate-1-semialdehyde 2,1-aminomutase [Thermosyntropha lipolytica DSM 11003]|uniref:Glutamate-1-semialdehyde 2,1-aminomutase n=1 Tax=Thermosyntropha lipolytica DSM 11003 TaxID=1123382 RepID=A0A1M5NJN6_9FIRM|nr:glutamate-1-semialdehyde 2,1-aminomutase [Thermosyntropha lipolytica]SHG89419.1 glutamate-1-semialdehyde 2,1-aminomutase [Thermosyntropha lipolytica DSM 11003]